MDTIEQLTELFKEFPGIGERQAKRFVYFLISKNLNFTENLSKTISDLKKEIYQCYGCFGYFIKKDNEKKMCDICSSQSASEEYLLIIEKDSDMDSIRKSKIYNGKYFILGGLVPIVENTTKKFVRIEELKSKIKNNKNLKEIILAFSISPQGNHTDFYVRNELKEIIDNSNIKISSLGRGLSTGTELEYSDNDTIKNAIQNRQ